jgi:hypothetical protein
VRRLDAAFFFLSFILGASTCKRERKESGVEPTAFQSPSERAFSTGKKIWEIVSPILAESAPFLYLLNQVLRECFLLHPAVGTAWKWTLRRLAGD